MSKPFKRRNNIRMLLLLIFVCMIIGFLLFATPFLKIDAVDIEGSNYYSKEEIMEKAEIVMGMHILEVNKKRSVQKLSALPYVEDVQIETQFPNLVQIDILERKPIGYVPFSGTYLSIDKTGQIIDQTQFQEINNLPVIEGLKFERFILGQQLEVENEEIIMAIIEIATLMEKYHLREKEIRIDVGDPNRIRLYINSLDVIIGEINNLDKKIQWLCEIIDQYEMGILDLSNIDQGQAIMSPLT